MSTFKRGILSAEANDKVIGCLQQRLVDSIDLSLQLKQAHWCVIGSNFRAIHLQLDEILADARTASDDDAERISTLGVAPDGRAKAIAAGSNLKELSNQFESAGGTVTAVADRLQTAVSGLRDSIGKLGELDPVSEDLLIGIAGSLEKHLWMVQAQEA